MERKLLTDKVAKDVVEAFKKRQRGKKEERSLNMY